MWTVCVLYILALNICETAGQDNSTQMYYFKLKVEEGAIPNVTAALRPFVSNTSWTVNKLIMTTRCEVYGNVTWCSCAPSFRWSDRLCPECCGKHNCSVPGETAGICVSDESVSIRGSITLTKKEAFNCLKEKESKEFISCNRDLSDAMRKEYSTIEGFEAVTISQYRVGSVIADFEIAFAYEIKQNLIDKSENLSKTLKASIQLETTGVVNLTMPPNPVCRNHTPTLKCTAKNLNMMPVWQLKRADKVVEIFDGTEADVTRTTHGADVSLKSISELWTGEYTCVYRQKGEFTTINHTASAVMNVSVLPKIDITMTPPFPQCLGGSEFVNVKVKCEIGSNNESYKVTWTANHADIFPTDDPHSNGVLASCNNSNDVPIVKCTFKNTCKENTTASAAVNIIYAGETPCKAEGDWKVTKAGFEAVLRCTSRTGERKRKCSAGGEWETERSTCVKEQVNNVLEEAKIIDIGQGRLDDNAARVFSRLHNVTKDSATINTSPDINASVSVLSTLTQKIRSINDTETVRDFLSSSSNLLDSSLNESWTKQEKVDNFSLAERYLDSFEQLIHITNLRKKESKENVEAVICKTSSECNKSVFNNSVELSGKNPGDVKTAGIKQLGNYLPQQDDTPINSIIVSVTTENRMDSVEVRINFSLIRQRPRDVEIKCVAWDNTTRSWSSEGCEWDTSGDGLCICKHLSSFAVLMSNSPLNITGLSELTIVGLSVSTVSLILTLVIEMAVWSSVVRTDQSFLRHTAHVNICLCLLVADSCLLASLTLNDPKKETWCRIFVVLKHFSYLAMFFWMFSLSSALLLMNVFVFVKLSRNTYLRLSLFLGYVCPFLIVVITFLSYNNGAKGEYYSVDTCWLCYAGLLKGSIHTFVLPVGTIAFFNVFSMVVVIYKLLDRSATANRPNEKERNAAVTAIRTVILLTPIFGLTWIFGFAILLVDLTSGPMAYAVHYIFTLLNTFQGLFILLTTYLADKSTREALLQYIRTTEATSVSDSTTKLSTL